MGTIKVNVWQMGYTTIRESVLGDRDKAVCRPMGHVFLEETYHWEEDVWHLLNWGCWSENGKPEGVHVPIDHCGSDVIIQKEGENTFWCASIAGWQCFYTLDEAIKAMRVGFYTLWPFYDVRRVSGHYTAKRGKVYWRLNNEDEWEEVTW